MDDHSESKSPPLPSKGVKVILVFVHGFKGNDDTFAKFPERLEHMLSEASPELAFSSVVFPAYETKGELPEAVVKFADWLTSLTVEKESETGLGSGSVKIVLCGHSMGGLLIVDTLLEFEKSRKDGDPLWPRIIAAMAYDTPYYGLHPHVFKNSATKAAEHLNAATTIGSAILGGWAGLGAKKASDPPRNNAGAITAPPANVGTSKWGTVAYGVGGALFAGAAAGSAYWKKDDLTMGYTWLNDHIKYVGTLWEEKAMKQRMEALSRIMEHDGVVFRNFYSYIPATPPAHFHPRTFILLPKPTESPLEKYFIKSQNHLATDELNAHTGMFSGGTNGGFFELGLNSGKAIRDALDLDIKDSTPASTTPDLLES